MSTSATRDTQQLIDQRLDAIDRALLGLLPRGDRLTIVAQLETRLRDLAAASPAVEAQQHLPAEDAAPVESALSPGIAPIIPAGTRLARLKRSRLALSSGILGIVALVALFVFPITFVLVSSFGEMFEEAAMVLLGTHLATVAVGGTAAVALGIAGLVVLGRRPGRLVGHGWAITGLCTGPLPMFAGGLIALAAGMPLLHTRSVVGYTNVAQNPANGYASPAPVGAQPMTVESVQFTPGPYPSAPSPLPTGAVPQYAAGPPPVSPPPLSDGNPPPPSVVPVAYPGTDGPSESAVPVVSDQPATPLPGEAPAAGPQATVR